MNQGISLTTIANNCFNITAEGTVRTASYGGPAIGAGLENAGLDNAAALNTSAFKP